MARKSILISTSPQQAFAYLSDFSRHGEWAQDPLRIDAPPRQIESGSRFRSRGRQLGQDLEDELTVTGFEPGVRLAFESRGRGGLFRHEFEFKPVAEGTIVSKEMTAVSMPFPFSLIRWTTPPFLALRMDKDLRRIKARLES
jgi:hypothetical protein